MTSKKHVLFINNINTYGGSTLSFLDILSMLKDEYTITIGLPPHSESLMHDFESKGHAIHQFEHFPKFSYYSGSVPFLSPTLLREILNFKYLKTFAEEINQIKPDFVILNSMVLSLVGKYIDLSIKCLCIVRETAKHTPIDLIFKHVFENYFDVILFIAGYDKDYFELKKTKAYTLPDVFVVPTLETTYQRMDSNSFNLLFLGGLDPIKGLDVLLKAISLLNDRSIKLLLAGEYSPQDLKIQHMTEYINPRYLVFKHRVNKYMSKLMKTKQIEILGFQNDLSAMMHQSDALIFPSTAQHQSRPAIEAGYYKVPVIISDYKATQEYFKHGYNCLTFKPHSARSLSFRIMELRNDPKLYSMIVQRNHQESIKKHDYSTVQSSLLDILNHVVSEGT